MIAREDGLNRLLSFLKILVDQGVEHRLEQRAPDSISVDFSLVGMRVEVDFDADTIQYSVFRGDEAVETDYQNLLDLIQARTE